MNVPVFEIAHIGVNCENDVQARQCAEWFANWFGLALNPQKESADACFTGTQIEWMKVPGRGRCGHIALATEDLPAARRYLEKKGVRFDDNSVKFTKDGRILVIYAEQEFGGFAVHLLQK